MIAVVRVRNSGRNGLVKGKWRKKEIRRNHGEKRSVVIARMWQNGIWPVRERSVDSFLSRLTGLRMKV